MYIYTYVYTCICMYMYMCIYIYIYCNTCHGVYYPMLWQGEHSASFYPTCLFTFHSHIVSNFPD